MTSAQRAVIAVVAILAGIALATIGSFNEDSGLLTLGTTLVTAPLAYAFGDSNGEKRLARALTILKAERDLGADDAVQ